MAKSGEHEKGHPNPKVREIHHEAHVGAAQFHTNVVGYDAAHDLAFSPDGLPAIALINLNGFNEIQRVSAQQHLASFSIREEAFGEEAKRADMAMTNPKNCTLIFASRADRARYNKQALHPNEPPVQRFRDFAKTTKAKHLLYQDYEFEALKEWLTLSPKQRYAVRSLTHAENMYADTPVHYFAITAPHQDIELLYNLHKSLTHLDNAPLLSINKRITASNLPEPSTKKPWGGSVMYDIAHDMQPDASGRYYCESINNDTRNDDFWPKHKEHLKKPEFFTSTFGEKSTPLADITNDNTFTLRLRLNPAQHKHPTALHRPAKVKKNNIPPNALEATYTEAYGQPLTQWLREQNLNNFAIGLSRIPSPLSHIHGTPDSCLLRITVADHDMQGKLLLGAMARYINEFRVNEHDNNPQAGRSR